MSLRKPAPITPREVLEANENLSWAVDTEDEARVIAISAGSHRPSQDGVNRAFLLAVERRCEFIVKLFISKAVDALKPEQRCIDASLSILADEGLHVQLIAALQELASWKEQQELHRHINIKRKEGNRWPYLVTMTEPNTMEEIQSRQQKHDLRLAKPLSAKNMFEVIMNDQRWINRTFFDAVHSHLKLTVLHLLTVPNENEQILKPDQTTINDSFAFCVRKGYLSMAQLLLQPPHPASLGANQQGFDQAVLAALEDGADEAVCRWVFSGRCGFAPTVSMLDEIYLDYARRISPDRRILDGYDVSTFAARLELEQERGPRRRVLRFMRRITKKQRQDGQEYMRCERLVAAVAPRASEEARRIIEREYVRATARQRAMQMFRGRQQGADIHSFSGTAVGPALEGEGALDDELVEDGEEAGEDAPDAVANGVDGDQVVVDGEPGDDGRAVVGANPWEAPPRRARVPTGRMSLHDAVLRNLERRVGHNTLSATQINQLMGELIEANFTSQSAQASTMRIVSEGMSDENFRVLGLALQFLHTHHPHALGMWIQGFLAESIAVNSCREGAMERIITGLRGVEDPELQQIFAQAEGPNLARIFLTGTFNIYYSSNDERSMATARHNATHLAEVLVDAGVDAETTVEDVTQRLGEYARRRVAEYGVRVEDWQAQEIDRVVETVGDGYEDYLLPYVREELQRRSERASSLQSTVEMDVVESGNVGGGAGGSNSLDAALNES